MPRKSHLIHTEYPYHINCRTHAGRSIQLNMPHAWEVMCDYLFFVKHAYKIKIYSFVLMSNHFHLVASTPLGNLSEAMNYFMRETSKEFNRLTGDENQFYGTRYYRTLITKPNYWTNVYKYVYRNPVEAGLAGRCEDYHFSTLNGLLGRHKMVIPVEEDKFIFDYLGINIRTLDWLNASVEKEHVISIEKALKRKEFYLPKDPRTKKPHFLEAGRL